jgi:hypothetical protein
MANVNNPIVSGLPDYVEEKAMPLLRKGLLGGDSLKSMHIQTGIKGTAALNYLDVTAPFQDGSECGFNPSGADEFTQRDIKTGQVKIEKEWCFKKLIGKWTEYQFRIGANSEAENIPFEQDFMDGVMEAVADQVENKVWNASLNDGDQFDGLLTILASESASTVNVTLESGVSAYDAVKEVILAIPEIVIKKGDARVFVSPELYRQLGLELMEKNLFHYNYENGVATDDIVLFPGTNIKVQKVNGLAGTEKIVAGRWDNLYAGMDLENGMEQVRLWFDDRAETFCLRIYFNLGTQVAFPDEVVVAVVE